MKQASRCLRLAARLLVVVAFTSSLTASARAENAEARAAVMLRDRPAANGHVVERLPAGAKLNMVEMSADGAWARVRTKTGREGWVPVSSVRSRGRAGGDDDGAAEAPSSTEDQEALAKRRNVRPEAWVSKSKYHDDDNKMTVVVPKAELFGRPQATGTVLGIVRRGEIVTFVRRSADKNWVQIDIGAGELAWVDAKAVRQGSDMPRAGEEPAEEPRRPVARGERAEEPPPVRRRDDRASDEPPPVRRREERREEPPPPATPSRRRGAEEPSPDDLRRADRARDEEPPPGVTRRKDPERKEPRREDEDRPVRREARAEEEDNNAPRRRSRRDEEEETPPARRRRASADSETTPSSRPKKPPHGKNYVDARVRVGFARVAQQMRTNGTSTTLLTNYQHVNTNLAIGAQLGYSRAFGKLRLHIDGKYLFIGGGAVLYQNSPTVTTQLAVLDQNFGGGVAVGGFFDAAGGIDLRLRVGADIWVNQISPSNPPLSISSDIVLAMAIGIEFAMPEVFYIAGRPLGFRLKGGVLAPGTRMQQPNLRTAPNNTNFGGYAGLEIGYGILKNVSRGQLYVGLGYDFSVVFTHFTGQCPATTTEANRVCRDDTVDDANNSSSAHIGTLGIYYQY